ncbi:MAG: hypothetical protein H5T73_01995 [Actinobacteria bacterium]|nr:hypothetical protein [Actinomycetota bacterium]
MEGAQEIIRIEDPEIDAREIMARIEERLRAREKDLPPEMTLEELEEWGKRVSVPRFEDPLHELSLAIEYARHYAPVSADHPIASSKPVIGPLVVLVKRVIRKFMRLYLDLVFSPQSAFNGEVLEALEKVRELLVEERALCDGAVFDRLSYYLRWGEDREKVKERVAGTVELFPPGAEIVNLYAGRGEFLLACSERGREALGVEADAGLVGFARESGLRVEHMEPRQYLEKAATESLKAVFVYEFGERSGRAELYRVVELLGHKMAKGAPLVVLNHCPRSLFACEAAYRDPTVLRLVHPETMHFILSAAHFQKVEIEYLAGPEETAAREELAGLLAQWEQARPGAGGIAGELLGPAFYLVKAWR